MRTFVIAEVGVNHNGNPEQAMVMIDVAADCGADAVKFQVFRSENLVTGAAQKAEYQARETGGGNQLDMLRALELPRALYPRLKARCVERGIAMLVTPFDVPGIYFLAQDIGLDTLKLPSGEISNAQMLLHAARTGRKIILSTGMSTMDEVERALAVLAFGYAGEGAPASGAFATNWARPAGRTTIQGKVTLLHCTTEYPAPFADTNLNAMASMRDRFGLPVGLSDHTPGIAMPIAAVALGAVTIEKHFTLSRLLPGPDHKASLEPSELKAMIDGIRAVESAMGTGEKAPQPSELKNIDIARRSVVAAHKIAKGEVFSEGSITAKRPGGGLDPMRYWDLIGRRASRDYAPDEAIRKDELP